MNGKMSKFLAMVLLLAMCAFAERKMALVIMLDGQRGDSIENLYMPNIERLRNGEWQDGYKCAWSECARTVPDARPSSAANHTAIATGVVATKNNVFANDGFKKGNYAEWPTWLARLKAAKPEAKALFSYSWKPDEDMGVVAGVECLYGNDWANAKIVAERLASPDAPDATMFFIDAPDYGGHVTGFYPYGPMYKRMSYRSDAAIGGLLTAIGNRSTFKDEDWMIVIVGDHGGYATNHGMWGGHAPTVPLIVVGKNVKHGKIPGILANMDTAATVLDHFGLYSNELNLDGVPRGKIVVDSQKPPLKSGLQAYFTFDEKNAPVNHAGTTIKAVLFGEKTVCAVKPDGFSYGFLHIESTKEGETMLPSGVRLDGSDKMELENGRCMTVTCWVRMPATPQKGDPLILGNKDWKDGKLPGCALVAARSTESAKAPGVCLNYARSGKTPRNDMGTFDVEAGKWIFYAFTFAPDGAVRFYQGRDDGYLYCLADHSEDAVVATGKPWHIGQDGTGNYNCHFLGDIDDFAMWNRSLDAEDIRRIYDAGRKGLALSDVIE